MYFFKKHLLIPLFVFFLFLVLPPQAAFAAYDCSVDVVFGGGPDIKTPFEVFIELKGEGVRRLGNESEYFVSLKRDEQQERFFQNNQVSVTGAPVNDTIRANITYLPITQTFDGSKFAVRLTRGKQANTMCTKTFTSPDFQEKTNTKTGTTTNNVGGGEQKANLAQIQEQAFGKDSKFLNLAEGGIGGFIAASVPLLFGAAGILLLLYLIWGGFGIMVSAGDPKAVEVGKGRITAAVIGFVIIATAFFLIQLLGALLNISQFGEVFK